MNLLKSLSAKSTSGNNIECTGNARKVECDRRCDAILLHLQNALRTMKHQGRILFRQPIVIERADAVEMPQTARALNHASTSFFESNPFAALFSSTVSPRRKTCREVGCSSSRTKCTDLQRHGRRDGSTRSSPCIYHYNEVAHLPASNRLLHTIHTVFSSRVSTRCASRHLAFEPLLSVSSLLFPRSCSRKPGREIAG